MIGHCIRSRWLAPLCVVLTVATSCVASPVSEGANSSTVGSDPVEATSVTDETVSTTEDPLDVVADPGELVWVHDREPPDLHLDDPANGTDIASWIRQGLLEGLFGVDQALSFYPELLADEPTLVVNDDGTVRVEYQLRTDLVWSDGRPLTAADVGYTHRIMVEGCEIESDGSIVDSTNVGCEYQIGNRIGYELVTGFEVVDATRFAISFASFFPGWRGLYPAIYAEHAFGADAFEVNRNLRQWTGGKEILPSSGPLVFERWTLGRSMELGRNESYHGSVSPDVVNPGPLQIEGVRVLFVADLDLQVQLLSSGRAHLVMTSPQPELGELSGSPSFTVAAAAGPVFEHWGLNLLNPHLAKPEVREAVAYALDKSEMVAELYQPLLGSAVSAEGLGNAYWMTNQSGYEDHQQKYRGNNVAAAGAALRSAGYAQGEDGIWSHPTDGRLTLRAGTTAGNALREQLLDLGREQLLRAGIEVIIDSAPGGLFLTEGPFAPEALAASASAGRSGNPGLWDIAQFSWSSGPWPGAVTGIYRSGSNSNPYGFSNPEFDVAASDCDAIADDAARSACYNQLDSFVTTLDQGDDGLFIIPLTQRPHFYGFVTDSVTSAAVAPDLPGGGPLVNATDFLLAE